MSDIAVVWVALGTPSAPTPSAVKTYLREFLTDKRIVDMNPTLWRAILELFILPRRAKVSASKYASIWSPAGSPLLVNTMRQADALHEYLWMNGVDVRVSWAMRYGQPSLPRVLDGLRSDGVRRVLVVPAYPQYSGTTVASVYDEVARYMLASRDELELRFVRSFPAEDKYIEALAQSIERSWKRNGRPDFVNGDVLLLSYHGLPVKMARDGDPYPAECQATTEALRARLKLSASQCRMSFQSTFGTDAWLTPATIDTVAELGQEGAHRVDVACPAFVADCLETIEEIGMLNRERFAEATQHRGVFNRIDCLNNDELFIEAMADVVGQELAGWSSRTKMRRPQRYEVADADVLA